MKKLYTLTFLVFIISIYTANAQITFGPKIGGNFSKQNWKQGKFNESDPNYEYKLGWQVGGILEFGICGNFSIRPGVLINRLSTQYKTGPVKTAFSYTVPMEHTYRATYLQVPLDFVLSLPLSHYHLKLSVGPYFQRGISGNLISDSGYNDTNEKEILFKEIPDDYDPNSGDLYQNPWDFGINFGVGYQIEYFLISVQYGLGLTNTLPKYETEPNNYDRKDEANHRWSNFTFSLAYLFHPEK